MKAQWIWYDGDYELMLANQAMTMRYERDVFIPPFWRMDYFHTNVKFSREFSVKEQDRLIIRASGRFNVILDCVEKPTNCYVREFDGTLDVAPGNYRLTVSVYNTQTVPALYVSGRSLVSDSSFKVTCNDFEHLPAGCCGLTDPETPPERFIFSYEDVFPVKQEKTERGFHLDFGRETMAQLRFEGTNKQGLARAYYGESKEESLDRACCELTDVVDFSKTDSTVISKAFRFVTIDFEGDATAERVVAVREFVPREKKFSFHCENDTVNHVFQTSADTLSINARDFLLDGIKRDRWVWSGDAVQSYLMMYYSFFDIDVIERTMTILPNREPQKTFINHIMDYSFYWIIGLYDYYLYVGNEDYLRRAYRTAESIIAFAHTRLDENGLLVGRPEDWVFIDWANLNNNGEVCAEQMVYLKALQAMIKVGGSLGKDTTAYRDEFNALIQRVDQTFWDESKNCYIHSVVDGVPCKEIKRHANTFAIYYGLISTDRSKKILREVLLNDRIEPIVTPYMRFYELSALGEMGEIDLVMREIVSYWGDMLKLGATTFWERYDEKEQGCEHYAMYGRKYGRSLCHAWGASPLYLIGRYLVGLKPEEKGYASFSLRPQRSEIAGDYRAVLPMKEGFLHMDYKSDLLTVLSEKTNGVLYLPTALYFLFYPIEGDMYRIPIQAGKEYRITLYAQKQAEVI